VGAFLYNINVRRPHFNLHELLIKKYNTLCLFILCFLLLFGEVSFAEQSEDVPQNVFYAGAFFDVPPSGGNEASKYLVGPLVNKASGFTGDELSTVVENALRNNSSIKSKINIFFGDDNDIGKGGHALAVYVPRAQHDEVKFSAPGAPDEYLTIISISIAVDIFTDKAAERNLLQLESLYSHLLVGEQTVKSRAPLDAAGLAAAYQSLFSLTLAEVVKDMAEDLSVQRERANAAFQMSEFILPKGDKTPPEITQLIGQGGDLERSKLTLEFLHLVNKAVSDQLRAKGYKDVALLSPPTAWAISNVGETLARRLVGKSRTGRVAIRFYVDPTLEQGGDLRIGGKMGVLGYTVRIGLARITTQVLASTKLEKSSRLGVQLLARISRPQPGQAAKWVPVTVPEEARTAKGVAGADFNDVVGMERPTTREIAMSAMRLSARDLAPSLVDLMRNIADNRVENR